MMMMMMLRIGYVLISGGENMMMLGEGCDALLDWGKHKTSSLFYLSTFPPINMDGDDDVQTK